MSAFANLEPFVNALPLPVAIYAPDSDGFALTNGPFRLIMEELANGRDADAQTDVQDGARPERSGYETLLCEEARRALTDWRDHAVEPITLDWSEEVKLRPFLRPLFGRPGPSGVLVLLEPVANLTHDQRALTALGALQGVAITVDDRFGRLLARFGEAPPANDSTPREDEADQPAAQTAAKSSPADLDADKEAGSARHAAALPRSMTVLEQTAPTGARVRIVAEPGRLSEQQIRQGEEIDNLKALVRRLEAANSALVRRNSELMDQLTEAMETL